MKKYKVVPIEKKIEIDGIHHYLEKRFIVVDDEGLVIDDAQGYGFKTASGAHKAIWYTLGGGKEKVNNHKKEFEKFKKSNKKLMLDFERTLELNFKENIDVTEVLADLEKKYETEIPPNIKKYLAKY
jgi:hypothetical protein